MQNTAGPGVLSDCPTRLAIDIISNKWAVLVLFALSQRPRRHGELVEVVGGVSRKVLTQTLRRLGEYGLIERAQISSRNVLYSLTPLGETLKDPIETLTVWARDYGEAIADAQESLATAG